MMNRERAERIVAVLRVGSPGLSLVDMIEREITEAVQVEREQRAASTLQGIVLKHIEEAMAMVSALCKPEGSEGARRWVMSIPAQPDHDPDLVIARALGEAKELIEYGRGHRRGGR